MYACWRLRESRGGNWIQSAGAVEVGALLAETEGGIPRGEVGADVGNEFSGELVGVGLEGVGGEATERAALTCVKRGPGAG